jgi:hypothetical protein
MALNKKYFHFLRLKNGVILLPRTLKYGKFLVQKLKMRSFWYENQK